MSDESNSPNNNNNEFNNLFLEDSEDGPVEENLNYLFTSSDSSETKNKKSKQKQIPIKKSNSIDKNLNNIKQDVLNATTGMSIMGNQITNQIEQEDNDLPEFIDNSDIGESSNTTNNTNTKTNTNNSVKHNKQNNESTNTQDNETNEDNETTSETKTSVNEETKSLINNQKDNNDQSYESIESNPPTSPKHPNNKNRGVTNMVHSMLKKEDNVNGWDHDANVTITNWYNLFKQQSFIYQWVLDRNRKMSDRLATVSIIASSILGIFSAFKLWIDNDALFQTISNIILMFFNFGVALITSLSKRYVDDQKNESIRTYVEEVDSFLGELAAQVLKSPVYRMNADKFFKLNNDKYTKLVSCAPNLSITDLAQGKEEYKKYSAECTNV